MQCSLTVYRNQSRPHQVHLVAHQDDGVVSVGALHQVQLQLGLGDGQTGGVGDAEDDEGGLGVQLTGVALNEDEFRLDILQHDADTGLVGGLARVVGVDIVRVEELLSQSCLPNPRPSNQLDAGGKYHYRSCQSGHFVVLKGSRQPDIVFTLF